MAGLNRKVLYIESKKAGHNREISCKSGTLDKISSIEEFNKWDVTPKTGQLASMKFTNPNDFFDHWHRAVRISEVVLYN